MEEKKNVSCRPRQIFLFLADHWGNCNLTGKSPQISTRQSQTPDKVIETLCAKCATQEVFDGSHLSAEILNVSTITTSGCVKIFLAGVDLLFQTHGVLS